ncbi:MAG TPA: molybdenum cofactor biosynthesis protein B [Myxococcales bacterium]|nr:molybdenum cofactor biosynthesis protein B [Myxococcales bacterium]
MGHGHDRGNGHGHDHGGDGKGRGEHDRVPSEHKARAPRSAKVYVITCSDSRTEATDEGGRIIRDALEEAGHALTGSAIIPDDPLRIAEELERAHVLGAEFALVTGGTGLSSRDSTFEAISRGVLRPLPGFGELFRSLSYEEIGSAAMLSRAVAGQLQSGLFVFAMPGSPAAVRLACEKLILPELTHILEELSR